MSVTINLLSGIVPLNLILFSVLAVSIAQYVWIKYVKIEETEEANSAFNYVLLIIGIYFVVYGILYSMYFNGSSTGYSYISSVTIDQALLVPTIIVGLLAVIIASIKIKSNEEMESGFIGIPSFIVGLYGVFYGAGMISFALQNNIVLFMLEGLFMVAGIAGTLSIVLVTKKRKGMAFIIIALLIIAAVIAIILGMYSVYIGSGYIWQNNRLPNPFEAL